MVASPSDTVDDAVQELERALALLKRKPQQIRSLDDRAALKSLAYAWFKSHRQKVAGLSLDDVDNAYNAILSATDRASTKATYVQAIKSAKIALTVLRSRALQNFRTDNISSDDVVPDFSSLVGNEAMQQILGRRWEECRRCVRAEAHLAAIVMMGGLLEAMFVAKANQMEDKTPLISAAAAPKDRVTGKTQNYNDWMLDSYIKVARELNWITPVGMHVADALKEFRNYVHPAKELRHTVIFEHNDSSVLWEITKSILRQLLRGAETGATGLGKQS